MTPESIFKQLKDCKGKSIKHCIETSDMTLDLSHSIIPEEAFLKFSSITKKIKLIETFNSFFFKNTYNFTEKKSVNHHQLRSKNNNFYTNEKKRLLRFIDQFHAKDTNPITDIVQIGIGGSYIGPKAIYTALYSQAISNSEKPLRAHFIANIDPIEFKLCMNQLSPKNTLFLVASKSGSTLEVKTNIKLLQEWWESHNLSQELLKEHCIVLTSKQSSIDNQSLSKDQFYIDNTIGGRFSTTSVIGMCLIGLCFGSNAVKQILSGANIIDNNSQNSNITNNIALAAAWEHIWQRNIKNYSLRTVITYSYSLQYFPSLIQQLTCESNGKSVDKNNKFISYKTAPMIISSIGTTDQHSFFQLLHQGTNTIPVEFIGVKNQAKKHHSPIEKEANTLLNTNMNSQIKALESGEKSDNAHVYFKGNKPSSLILLNDITPYILGQLIAFYENKTIFEGLIWNINSFDQMGVELAKKLTKTLSKN
ncbi:hypothetical protein CL658_03120 [bacterium]|nr:hypothetical protein [bacterium]